MAYSDYVPVTGTIVSVSMGTDCCEQMAAIATGEGIVNFMIGPETHVIDSRRLRPGMAVGAFYDSNLPVPMIFPPQYRAQIITALNGREQVLLSEFNNNLVAADGSLSLNVAGNTVVRTINGQNFTCSLGNRTLLVYYTTTTRSIPPQTIPRKIIVLC